MSRQIGKSHYYKGVNLNDELLNVFRVAVIEEVLRAAEANCNKEQQLSPLGAVETGILGGTMLLKEVSNPYAALNCLARIGWEKLAGEICRNVARGYNDEMLVCGPQGAQTMPSNATHPHLELNNGDSD
ncbi:unnamed protein product, partial [Mesorhabditis spiculigera]